MEHVRKKYICKQQIQKGLKGVKEIIQLLIRKTACTYD